MTTRQQRRRDKRKPAERPENATEQALKLILNDPAHEVAITPVTLLDLVSNGVPVRPAGDGHVRIAGTANAVRVTNPSSLDGKDFEYLVCRLWNDGPQEHLDNVRGTCVRCFRDVRHRPNVPKGIRPICVECLPGRLQN